MFAIGFCDDLMEVVRSWTPLPVTVRCCQGRDCQVDLRSGVDIESATIRKIESSTGLYYKMNTLCTDELTSNASYPINFEVGNL